MVETSDAPRERWWQWHLGNRMARHQHAGDEALPGCSWPDCAWHGYHPGEEHLVDSLPEVAPQSVALRHLTAMRFDAGFGGFVYERDADLDEERFLEDAYDLLD